MPNQNIIRCDFSTKKFQSVIYSMDPRLVCVLEGALELALGNKEHRLGTGEFYLVNSGQGFAWKAEDSALVSIVTINYSMLSGFFEGRPLFFRCDSAEMHPELAKAIRDLLNRLFTCRYSNEGDGRLMYYSCSYRLIHMLCSACLADYSFEGREVSAQGTMKRSYDILDYVCENYMYPITLQSMADHFHLTTSYLSRMFKTKLDTNFMTLLQNIRLEHALNDIVYTNKSMTSIALDNGFPNSASFIKKFREAYHTTPLNYRKEHSASGAGEDASEGESGRNENIKLQVNEYLKTVTLEEEDSTAACFSGLAIRCSTRSGKARMMRKPWRKLMNIGPPSGLLRYDAREQIRILCEELQFEYIYINNLQSSEMKIVPDRHSAGYNFSEIQRILDYIMALGCHPYIELEAQGENLIRSMDKNILRSGVKNRLGDFCNDTAFINSLLSFLINHYGVEEMSRWYISIERSTAENNRVDEKDYFRYFASVYRTVKARVPGIRIGGPGFTVDFGEKKLESFLKKWLESSTPPDFVNLYVFPYVLDKEKLKGNGNNTSTDRFFLPSALNGLERVMRRLNMSGTETHVSLWNSTLVNRNVLNDSCFKAAYIMNSMIRSWDHCDLLGYWNMIDISTVTADTAKPLFGGNGIISQNGIRKPAYFAFYFLNRLLPKWVAQIDNVIVTTDGAEQYAICCHNYKHFNYHYYQIREESIQINEQQSFFEDNEKLRLTIELTDLHDGEYLIKKRYVNWSVGNIQSSWDGINRYEEIGRQGINYLTAQSEPGLKYRKESTKDGTLKIEELLEPQEIMILEVRELEEC